MNELSHKKEEEPAKTLEPTNEEKYYQKLEIY